MFTNGMSDPYAIRAGRDQFAHLDPRTANRMGWDMVAETKSTPAMSPNRGAVAARRVKAKQARKSRRTNRR